MLLLVILAAAVSLGSAAPTYYNDENYLIGPALVSGHHLPSPLLKTYAHPTLYGSYPVLKTPVVPLITPGAGFIKAPLGPTAYGILGGHYGHVSPYLH